MPINQAAGEHVLDRVVLQRVCLNFPLVVRHQLLRGDIILPLLALEDAQNEPVVVVIFGRQSNALSLQVLPESVELLFFFFAQLLLEEYQSLVLAAIDREEDVILRRAVRLAGLIDVTQGIYLFFCQIS